MNRIANTPEPPYYAVIAPAEHSDDIAGYAEEAEKLFALAREQPGFLGIESCAAPGFTLAVSYWSSLDAIATWRRNAMHGAAKKQGMQRWFRAYLTRIARVDRAY